jgi:hypothetical protein
MIGLGSAEYGPLNQHGHPRELQHAQRVTKEKSDRVTNVTPPSSFPHMEVGATGPRAQELWFEDGTVVIQAGNSLYRVFRGILAARSPVFRDMFQLPQPPDCPLFEGCPVVQIWDSPTELTALLRAIFEPEFVTLSFLGVHL